LGGGALFFELRSKGLIEAAVLSDINEDLIQLYLQVRDDVDGVVQWLREVFKLNEEDFYYHVRSLNPLDLEPSERAARFIYLNRTCFNGLYRVNKKGEFNVPFGKYANPTLCNEEKLRAASAALQGVELHLQDFRKVLEASGPGDFVYFDPPFYPVSETANFTSFTADDFSEQDHVDLRDLVMQLAGKGVRSLVSNSDTPFVLKIFPNKDFHTSRIAARRNINSKGEKRGPVSELLITV
jgi:DNA adenine methylase